MVTRRIVSLEEPRKASKWRRQRRFSGPRTEDKGEAGVGHSIQPTHASVLHRRHACILKYLLRIYLTYLGCLGTYVGISFLHLETGRMIIKDSPPPSTSGSICNTFPRSGVPHAFLHTWHD